MFVRNRAQLLGSVGQERHGLSVRRRAFPLLFIIALLLLAAGCRRAASPEGWTPPTAQGDTLYVSIENGKLAALEPQGPALSSASPTASAAATPTATFPASSSGSPLPSTTGSPTATVTPPAVSPSNGAPAAASFRIRWEFPKDDKASCGGGPEESRKLEGIYGAPVVRGNKVYFGAYDGNVYALDTATGACAWAFKTDGPIIGGLALAVGDTPAADRLYAASDDGKLYALNPESGVAMNVFDAGSSIWTTPLINGNNIYFGTVAGTAYALRSDTLAPVWSKPFETEAALISDPVLAGDKVIIGGIGWKLFALDAKTGNPAWDQPVKGDNWFWGRPLVDGKTIYAPNLDHKVYAVNADTGAAVWPQPFKADDGVRASPLLAGGSLIVADREGNIFSVDPATGAEQRPPTILSRTILSDPVPFGGDVLVMVQGGNLYHIDPRGEAAPRLVAASFASATPAVSP
ncbi:MAG: hypothetical protein E6J42_03960 [Chloroflexi bacterium]|nr:MAG: hypothetical protein E6J42_03960 [Chloroflexota bacterium]